MANIKTIDKDNMANGVVRISFIQPELDILICCKPKDLLVFVRTVETLGNIYRSRFSMETLSRISSAYVRSVRVQCLLKYVITYNMYELAINMCKFQS